MSKIYDANKKLIITTPFPYKVFSDYLSLMGVSSLEGLNLQQTKHVFVLAIADFKTGKVSLDDLSSMCNALLGHVTKTFRAYSSELADVLLAGAELSYYVRQSCPSPILLDFLNVVMAFYEKHKSVKEIADGDTKQ